MVDESMSFLPEVFLIIFVIGIGASPPLEGQGPLLELEPPARLDFSNASGARLECAARGSPPPAVKWLVADGAAAGPVPGLRHQASNGSLVLPPFGAADFRPDVHRNVYRCQAANALGRVLSREVKVRAVVMQQFRVEAIGDNVTRGNTGILRCHVPAHVREFVTVTSWLQDHSFNIYPSSDGDGKLHMLPTGELVVRGAVPADSMSRFQCRVTHRLSGETRASAVGAQLAVAEPRGATSPRFAQRLLSVEARRDELVVLPCVAHAHPPPEYRWEVDGSVFVADEQRYAASGLLVIPRARPAHSGRYACEASNAAGSARLELSLLVSAPLSVRVQPPLLTAALGQPARFSCATQGHPVTSLRWFKDGQPVRSAATTSSGAEGSHLLTLPSVSKDDQGMYQCFVKNEHDMAQGTAELRLGDTPPILVYSFISQTIQPGPSVSLKCVASGNPTPQIKWTLDGFKLPQSDRFVIGQYVPMNGDVVSHVNITNVRVEDGGTYQCTATNRIGEVTHSAKLNVYGLPHVRPMGEISAIAGENLVITCPVSGFPISSVKWYRVSAGGDRPIPFNFRHLVFPNGTLVIENVQSGADDGIYRCTASNKQGDRSSATAQINATVPPRITPFSFRSDLHLGDRVGVQCVVSRGDPPLNIVWLKDGQKLSTSDRDGVAVRNLDEFTSVLTISPLSRGHGGNYTCVVRNGAAQSSESATLSVNVPPAITPFTFGELTAGERVRVTCNVKRGDPPLTIRWLKDARPILSTPHDDPDLNIQATEEYSSVLAIRSVSSRHSGNYTCVVANKARTTSHTAQLLVTVPPTWVIEPQSKSAKLNEPALLDCKVEGFPRPVITWKKAIGKKLESYHALVGHESKQLKDLDLSSPNSGLSLLPNGTLFFETVSQEDEGQYVCEARNGIGVGLSAVVYLTVNAPVHFKVRSRKEMVRRSGTAIMRCQAMGDLPITFSWRKEGSFMDLQRRSSVKNISGGLESELRISAVSSDDGGIYTCFARNGYGHDQTAIHLLVQDAPEHPTNLRVLDQSSRAVTVGWTPAQDGNSPITRYIIRYSPIQDAWQGPSAETVVEGTQSSGVVTGLRPATAYSVRVLAENTLGPGAASHELVVRTAEEAPSAAPQRLTAEAAGATRLLVAWEPPPHDHWNGPLLGHYVGYRLIGDSESKRQFNFTTVPFHGSGREDTQLTDLKKFSKYGLVVQAFNSKGPGPLSDEVIATTLEDVPEASPRDVRCTALSSESLQVSWQPPPEALVHGVIQGYRLVYEPANPQSLDEDNEPKTKITTALTAQLLSLMKYTNYSVELVAFTRVGDGVKSPKTYCRTKEDAPGPPSDIKAVLAKSDAALVAWLPPAHPNGVVIKYHVYVRVMENGRQVDARSVVHPASAPLQFQLPNLKRQTRYEFWVTAFTSVGEGKSTPVATVTPASKVGARIVSFGGVRTAAWRADVRLPCAAVGSPAPSRRWQRPGDLPVAQQPRAHVLPDGTLLLSAVQRTDQGEFACHVSNDHGTDHISYQLVVQVPPGAPVLLMTGSTQQSLQLQWKLGDSGGSPVRGFVLHYKHEHGEWEEMELDGSRSTHVLAGLRCGTQYHVFITALNRVGTGDPSATLNVRTRGAVPLRPQSSKLFTVNSTSVTLHLDTWPDGGCPLLYFVVEYTPLGEDDERWEIVGNNIATDKAFPLVGLTPGHTYKIRITAHNAAGSTIAQYKFRTLNEFGGTAGPSHVITRTEQKTPLHKDTKIVILTVFSIVGVILSFLGVCFCLKKRSGQTPSPHPSMQDMQTTATQENKHNLARSEKYYATIRKLSPSPGTLECIPEYSEDIRPYATFHVPGPPNADTTKLQTFVYRETDMSPSRKSVKSEYRRARRSRQSEEYDSFGSESDTEPGTSSRTESSNQLDSGGMAGDMARSYHSAARLSKIGLESMYPEPEWSPPIEISSGTERRPFVRKYCQAHHLK